LTWSTKTAAVCIELNGPDYDLINTSLHYDDTAMALHDGLFKEVYSTESFEANAFYAYDDFCEFGLKIGIIKSRVIKILNNFRSNSESIQFLTNRSFLNDEMKSACVKSYQNKLKALNYSMTGKIKTNLGVISFITLLF
jgi:serine/threonine-protein kinase HipA